MRDLTAGWREVLAALSLIVAIAALPRMAGVALLLGFGLYGVVSFTADLRGHLHRRR